jgi:hypothetical protein
MDGGDDKAALSGVAVDQVDQELLARLVEARGGFIKEPNRARGDEEPRQRQTARLPLAQDPGGELSEALEPDFGEGVFSI